MKAAVSGLTLAVASATSLCAETANAGHENPHAIYLGPDIFYEHEKASDVSSRGSFKTKISGVYGGPRVRYDFLRPSFLYVGLDGLYSWGKVHQEVETIT